MTSSSQVSPWRDFIVHLPTPDAFASKGGAAEVARRAELLRGVRYFVLVGSLDRPRRIAKHAVASLGMSPVGSYFDLADDRGVADREFNIEVISLDGSPDAKVAIVSHGIGMSGAEIVIAELFALVNLVHETTLAEPRLICGVGRSGTRGTLANIPYGTVGINTVSYSDTFETATPDPTLMQLCAETAKAHDIPYRLGPGISTRYFWSGQGRALPLQRALPHAREQHRQHTLQEHLWEWVERGIAFVEMEDHTVSSICQRIGIPSVTMGVVIARRYDPAKGQFVLDYDLESKKRDELLPAEVLLRSFREHWSGARDAKDLDAYLGGARPQAETKP